MKLASKFAFLVAIMAATTCHSYEIATHYLVAARSFYFSDLQQDGVALEALGLKPLAAEQKFPTTFGSGSDEFSQTGGDPLCAHSVAETLARLISCGAMFEDVPGRRVLNHFFDPAHNGRPLSVTVLAGPPSSFPPPLLFVTYPSPDWALGEQSGANVQDFSYAKARAYFFMALTEPDLALRSTAWGQTFQSLGQVIHHLADMAQPQHVRNDPHLDLWNDFLNNANLGLINHASRFEKYAATDRNGVAKVNNLLRDAVPVYPMYSSNFTVPRRFWIGDGKGLAEFTNSNFVSYGTNFVWQVVPSLGGDQGQPLPHPDFTGGPAPGGPHDESMASLFNGDPPTKSIDDLCNDQVNPPTIYLEHCFMTFYSSNVVDQLTGEQRLNGRASTYSVFDEDLELYNQTVYIPDPSFVPDPSGPPPPPMVLQTIPTKKIFALNRFNFDTALDFLIPRATAYGAGLLNYFFRGKMIINPPSAGVYAIVDQTAQGCKDACGFSIVKLRLKNTTPNEAMSNGFFEAIAKFHRNTCYQQDLSGDPGGTEFLRNGCGRSTNEEILVSSAGVAPNNMLTGLGVDEEREVTFTFATPIPINASDIYLQVMFKGKLGQEDNAIAVATRDISEPNYYALMNATDLVYDPGIYDTTAGQFGKYFKAGDPGYESYKPIDITNIRVALGANSALTAGTAIATVDKLTGGQYAQFAMLMEQGQTTFSEEFAGPYVSPGEQQAWYTADDFTMDDEGPAAGKYTRSCPVEQLRGRYWIALGFFVQQVSFTKALATAEVRMISIGNTAAASANPSAPQRKALPAAYCLTSNSGGIFNFGDKFNLDPNNALVWQVNF